MARKEGLRLGFWALGITLIVALLFAGNIWSGARMNASADAAGEAGSSQGWFIKFEGIEGESMDKDHKGWSEILSFNQAITRTPSISTSASSGASRRRGEVVLEDMTVQKVLDKASPKLAEACLKGMVFPKVEIHFTEAYTDAGRSVYYKYELKNVMLSGYSVGGSADEGRPTESLSFNFEEIKVTYSENDAAGKSKGKVEYTWKVEEGVK